MEHFVKILEGAWGVFTQNFIKNSAASFYDLFFTIVFQNSKIYILWDDWFLTVCIDIDVFSQLSTINHLINYDLQRKMNTKKSALDCFNLFDKL